MAAINLGMPHVGGSDFIEAKRQMDICNSCRYCAGYCPVWPALERRVDLTPADITHLANLCHDCRDCHLACMYTPPHEFGVNPPEVFAKERTETYHRFIWPTSRVRDASGAGVGVVAVVVLAAVLALLSWLTSGGAAFGRGDGSIYSVIQHDLLLALIGAPVVFSIVILAVAAIRYWLFTNGNLSQLFHIRAWGPTLRQALTLRHQAGADEGCTYPDGIPTQSRRILHQFVMVGFFLTFVSTVAAAFEQYALGLLPAYPYLSVPVLAGLLGGFAQILGCAGLLYLKRFNDRNQTTEVMMHADLAFLWALIALNATGLLVLFLRTTPVFSEALVVHLASVMVAFAVAPYTKFVHFIFRILAIFQNVLEEERPVSRKVLTPR